MRRIKIIPWLMVPLLSVMLSGCGGFTAAGLMQKGGMWLAKEAFKKGVKELREDKEHGSKEDEMSRGRKSERNSRREHRHDDD